MHRSRRITASFIRLQAPQEHQIGSNYSDCGRMVAGAESPVRNKLKRIGPPPPNVKQSINGTPQWQPQSRNPRNRRVPPVVLASNASGIIELPSRIPTVPVMPQNFNQISKTATNLLNDIYERHLLNQTTFDGATASSGTAAPSTCTSNGANWRTMRTESDFNFNNLCYEEPHLPPSSTTMAQPTNFQAANMNATIKMQRPQTYSGQQKLPANKITKNSRMPRRSVDQSIMVDDIGGGEDSTSASHERNGRVCDNNVRPFHQQTFSSKWNANDDKIHGRKIPTSYMSATGTAAAAENHGNVPLYEKIERTYAPHPNIIKSHIFYDASDYGGGGLGHRKPFGKYGVDVDANGIRNGALRYQPTGENVYNNKASTPMALLSSSGMGATNGNVGGCNAESGSIGLKTAAKNFEYTNNSKINFMLETAQAMAAAAYFARFVCVLCNSHIIYFLFDFRTIFLGFGYCHVYHAFTQHRMRWRALVTRKKNENEFGRKKTEERKETQLMDYGAASTPNERMKKKRKKKKQ